LVVDVWNQQLASSWKQNKEHNTARRKTHIRTGGTIHQQLSINAERHQFPHPQILTHDDDGHFGQIMS
jgi:hypothetical protein